MTHLALVQRLALILEVSATETVTVSTQTIDLHHLHLVLRRHGFELGADVLKGCFSVFLSTSELVA